MEEQDLNKMELMRVGKVTRIYWNNENQTWVLVSDTLGETFEYRNLQRVNDCFKLSESRYRKF